MDFALTDRCQDFQARLQAFMDEHVHPAEPVYERAAREAGDPHAQPAVMEELKARARDLGLWNLFHPSERGAPASRTSSTPRSRRSWAAARSGRRRCNCNAPDTGNMEVLTEFGTPEQQDRWLRPLLDGEIRSGFAMTEPDVASSDATNIRTAHRPRRRRVRPQRAQVVDHERAAPEPAGSSSSWARRIPRRRGTGSRAWCSCPSTRPASRSSAACPCSATTTRRGTGSSPSRTSACRRRTSSPARATAS